MSNLNLEVNAITKFRLDEINKIKEYFNSEVKERKNIVKRNSVAFDYADKNIYYIICAIWYIEFSITCNNCRHSSRYCRVFINFDIYSKYWNN